MRARAVAIGLAAALGGAGCPRLPPPPPRPSVSLVQLDRAAGEGMSLRARFRVHNRGAAPMLLSAVDWEIALGERALLRGRSYANRRFAPDERAAVDIAIAIPAPLDEELRRGAAASGGRVRLRGTIHLEDPGGGTGAPAPFDELARLP